MTRTAFTTSPGEAPVLLDAAVLYRGLTSAVSYRVVVPPAFSAVLERDGDHWIVSDRVTGIHGCGDQPSEAIKDFEAALIEHLDVLEHQDALSDDLARQLEYLRVRLGK